MINEKQSELLTAYKDKCFISAILCEQSANYYGFIKNIINIPLIICNSIMVVINSIVLDENTLKILNIILNSSSAIILSLISNFKIYEKINDFHIAYSRYNKLMNLIHSKMTNNFDEITGDFINQVVNDYDNITDNLNYGFPNKIKKRIKTQYHHMTLPISLSVEIVSISDECKEYNTCCVPKTSKV
jgi:hypothetical protein